MAGHFHCHGIAGADRAVRGDQDDPIVSNGKLTVMGDLSELWAAFRVRPRLLYASLAMIVIVTSQPIRLSSSGWSVKKALIRLMPPGPMG